LTEAVAIYLLCLATSLACAGLLGRAYLRARTPFLLWTSISFGFFALNNLLLVTDMLVFTDTDLTFWRQGTAGLAVASLLYGFIWEVR
jgi:hypothetical protein